MTFQELDSMIRQALPDGIDRRNILDGLHSIEEGVNMCANFYLGVAGYKIREDGSLAKSETTTFQVNP